jgi:hypothetical protein
LTVRLVWDDERLHITAEPLIYKDFEQYFINNTIESRNDFNERCLPRIIGGFKLEVTDKYHLFRYEL